MTTPTTSRSPSAGLALLETIFTEPLLTGKHILSLLELRDYPLEKTGVSLRNYQNWRSEGLLPEAFPVSQHVLLTGTEFAWVRAIQLLKEFKFSLEQIRIVQQQLFAGICLSDILTLLKNNLEITRHAEALLHQSPLPEAEVAGIRDLLRSGATDEVASQQLPLLSLLVSVTLSSRQEAQLLVWPCGQVLPLLDQMHQLDERLPLLSQSPHVRLPLYALLEPLLEAQTAALPRTLTQSAFQLSGEEYAIIQQLRSGQLKELKIKFDQSRQPAIAEGVKEHSVKETDRERLLQLLVDSGHYEVNRKRSNKGHYYIEQSFSKRLRPKENTTPAKNADKKK